jgi:hypothetical protein
MRISMNRRHKEAALTTVLGLLAVAVVVCSGMGGESIAVAVVAFVLSMPVIHVGSLLVDCRYFAQRPMLSALIPPVVSLAIMISVAATQWPLRVTYALARNAFDAFAQRIRAGEQITTPARVGLFTIRHAELSRDGIVCLWTHPNSGGSNGFVQSPRDYVFFNLWSSVALDDRWQFISED